MVPATPNQKTLSTPTGGNTAGQNLALGKNKTDMFGMAVGAASVSPKAFAMGLGGGEIALPYAKEFEAWKSGLSAIDQEIQDDLNCNPEADLILHKTFVA